jgi:ParB/RepB/Spo0J family partition protein
VNKDDFVKEMVPLALVDTAWCVVRDSVDKSGPKYIELMNSIRETGIVCELIGRYIEVEGKVVISLVDGFRRKTAAQDVGVEMAPMKIYRSMSDDEAIAMQVLLNHQREGNSPRQLYNAMVALTDANETLSVTTIANMIGVSVQTVQTWAKMDKMHPDVLELVNRGVIRASNARTLSRIPVDEQPDWVERAKKYKVAEFDSMVKEHKRQQAGGNLRLRKEGEVAFVPYPRLKNEKLLKKEIEVPDLLVKLSKEVEGLSPLDILIEGVKFTLDVDRISYQERVRAHQKDLDLEKARKKEQERVAREKKIRDLQAKIKDLKKEIEPEDEEGTEDGQ